MTRFRHRDSRIPSTNISSSSGQRLRAELAVFLIVLCWAANYSIIQLILRTVPVVVFVTLRFFIIAIAGWLALAFLGRPARWDRKDFPRLLAIGVIGGGIYQYLFVRGLAETTSFSSALLNSTAPLLSLLILAVIGQERIASRQWAGNAIALAGVALFLLESAWRESVNLKGNLISFAAALCWAIYGILARPLSHRYSALTVGAWAYTFCFLSIASYGAAPTMQYDFSRLSPGLWALIAASGILSVTIGWNVWIYGIRVLGVPETVKFSFLVPISAGVIARIFQGEHFTTLKIAGALAVLSGIFLARVPGWRTPPVDVPGAPEVPRS